MVNSVTDVPRDRNGEFEPKPHPSNTKRDIWMRKIPLEGRRA